MNLLTARSRRRLLLVNSCVPLPWPLVVITAARSLSAMYRVMNCSAAFRVWGLRIAAVCLSSRMIT